MKPRRGGSFKRVAEIQNTYQMRSMRPSPCNQKVMKKNNKPFVPGQKPSGKHARKGAKSAADLYQQHAGPVYRQQPRAKSEMSKPKARKVPFTSSPTNERRDSKERVTMKGGSVSRRVGRDKASQLSPLKKQTEPLLPARQGGAAGYRHKESMKGRGEAAAAQEGDSKAALLDALSQVPAESQVWQLLQHISHPDMALQSP